MTLPILIFIVLIPLYGLTELAILAKNRTFFTPQKRDRTMLGIVIPFILVMVCAPLEYSWLHRAAADLTIGLGGLVVALGIAIRLKALVDLGTAFSMKVEKKENQALVTRGLYATIRHPLYLASLVIALGIPILLSAWLTLVFTILTIAGILARIRKEEQFMQEQFPGYAEYARKTWRLLPGIY
jgi:protein-S-isoprenylcysteine O-methyltransferase Ste14